MPKTTSLKNQKPDEVLGILRQKWCRVPVSVKDGEISTSDLLKKDDAALLSFWNDQQKKNLSRDGFAVRGWYHALYDGFVPGKKILDIGCGLGFDSVRFLELGARVTFADIDANNVRLVERICELKGLRGRADFLLMEKFEDLRKLQPDYDAIMAIGSLHHIPFEIAKLEVQKLLKLLKNNGRWWQLAYPKTRWIREGSLPFDEWGSKTNDGTPWTEWYDLEKIGKLFSPVPFQTVLDLEFYNSHFIWFDLIVNPSE